jgi:hypothetical protein
MLEFYVVEVYFLHPELRLLRNSGKSLLVLFFRDARGQSWLIFLQVQDVFAPLAAIVSQRGHVRSAGDPKDRFFQIEGHGIEQELQFDLGQTKVSGSKESVGAFEGTENAFHL